MSSLSVSYAASTDSKVFFDGYDKTRVMIHMSCSPSPSLGQESLSSKQIQCKYQLRTCNH